MAERADLRKRINVMLFHFDQRLGPRLLFNVADIQDASITASLTRLMDFNFLEENKAFTLVLNASDPDQEDEGKLQVTASNLPQGMTFDEARRELSWTPTYDQAGNYANIQVTVLTRRPSGPAAVHVSQEHGCVAKDLRRGFPDSFQ